jgi:hypothetical protein
MATPRARGGKAGPPSTVLPHQLPDSDTASPPVAQPARALPAPGCPVDEDELAALKKTALTKAVPRSAVAQADGVRRSKR